MKINLKNLENFWKMILLCVFFLDIYILAQIANEKLYKNENFLWINNHDIKLVSSLTVISIEYVIIEGWAAFFARKLLIGPKCDYRKLRGH